MISGKGDDAAGTKADDPNSNKSEKADDAVKPKGGAEADAPAKGKDGEAYEDGAVGKEESVTAKTPEQMAQDSAIADVESGKTPLEGYGEKKGNHKRKGNYGEMKMDQHMEGITDIGGNPADLKRISKDRVTGVDDTGHQGIDGVYENATPPPKYIIAESKYGSSELSQKPKDEPQMSDDWINGSNRLDKAVGKKTAEAIRDAQLEDPGSVQRVLVHVDQGGQVTTSSINSRGVITGPWP